MEIILLIMRLLSSPLASLSPYEGALLFGPSIQEEG